MRPAELEGKVAIVTGAGRGIGKAIAVALAREGANIVAVSRTLSEVEDTASEVKALKRRSIARRIDISDRKDVDAVVGSAIREFGRIDILVNNAGILGPIGPMADNDVEEWVKTISINLIGTYLCTRAVLPAMMKQRRGKIISLSGGGATSPRPHFTAYAASKAAVVRLTETLAEEVKQYNIQVNAVAPGAVNTGMLDAVLLAGEMAGEEALASARHQLATGGTSPGRAADLVVFLASDKSDGLTGRLISAVWDDWQGMAEHVDEIMASELYTLRRVVK